MAQAFDPDALTLSGEPIDLGTAPELFEAAGSRNVAASRNGTLAHLTPDDPNTRLLWHDPMTGQDLDDARPGAGCIQANRVLAGRPPRGVRS